MDITIGLRRRTIRIASDLECSSQREKEASRIRRGWAASLEEWKVRGLGWCDSFNKESFEIQNSE